MDSKECPGKAGDSRSPDLIANRNIVYGFDKSNINVEDGFISFDVQSGDIYHRISCLLLSIRHPKERILQLDVALNRCEFTYTVPFEDNRVGALDAQKVLDGYNLILDTTRTPIRLPYYSDLPANPATPEGNYFGLSHTESVNFIKPVGITFGEGDFADAAISDVLPSYLDKNSVISLLKYYADEDRPYTLAFVDGFLVFTFYIESRILFPGAPNPQQIFNLIYNDLYLRQMFVKLSNIETDAAATLAFALKNNTFTLPSTSTLTSVKVGGSIYGFDTELEISKTTSDIFSTTISYSTIAISSPDDGTRPRVNRTKNTISIRPFGKKKGNGIDAMVINPIVNPGLPDDPTPPDPDDVDVDNPILILRNYEPIYTRATTSAEYNAILRPYRQQLDNMVKAGILDSFILDVPIDPRTPFTMDFRINFPESGKEIPRVDGVLGYAEVFIDYRDDIGMRFQGELYSLRSFLIAMELVVEANDSQNTLEEAFADRLDRRPGVPKKNIPSFKPWPLLTTIGAGAALAATAVKPLFGKGR